MQDKIHDIKSKPVYDPKTGKLRGWKLTLLVEKNQIFSPVPMQHFFEETWYRNSHRAMCRFQAKFLRQQKVK